MEKMKTNQGITLIALIITIIILLILATITLEVALDGRLFNIAWKAVNDTNAKTSQEQNRVDNLIGVLNEIENKTEPGDGDETPNEPTPEEPVPGECEHTYGEWNIEIEATCTTVGTQARTCLLCNHKETQTIEATGHTYGESEVTQEVTCTTDGIQTITCTNCGDKQSQIIATTGHAYTDWEVTKEATVTSTGIATSTCTRCGDTQTMEIPKLEADGTIIFTIDGVEYTAEENMTWSTWVKSEYNTGGYQVMYSMYVTTAGGAKYLKPSSGSYYVQPSAKITGGASYKSVNYGMGGLYG